MGTHACREYFLGFAQINRFFHFVLHTVAHIDKAAETAHKALVSVEVDPEKRRGMEETWSKRKGAVDALRDHRQFLIEIILVRHIENFLNYLAALLFEIFTQRPETLRSSDRIEVEEVLRHSSVEAIVRAVAERKVEALSYSSFQDLRGFFRDRFSLELVGDEHLATFVHAIEVRKHFGPQPVRRESPFRVPHGGYIDADWLARGAVCGLPRSPRTSCAEGCQTARSGSTKASESARNSL
jgi:hypothetical protein